MGTSTMRPETPPEAPRLVAALLCAGLALAAARPAEAQRTVETETFHPALDSYGIFTVERGDTGKQWDYGFKIYADYAHQPLRLTMKDANGVASQIPLMDYQVTTHLGAHLSVFNWAELAVQLPVSAQSYTSAFGSIDDPQNPTGFYAVSAPTNVGPPDASPQDARLALKLRTPRLGPVGLALILAGTFPFGDKSGFLGDSFLTFRPTAVFDVTVGRVTAALNATYILRRTTVVLDPADVVAAAAQPATLIEVGQEIACSAGLAVRIVPRLGIGAEVYALVPLGVDPAPAARTAATPDYVVDGLAGLQIFPGRDVTLAVGGGLGLLDSRRHDTFRVFSGISWAPVEAARRTGVNGGFGKLDSDHDGIPDEVDLCPNEPEDKDGFDDNDGCPDLDNDQDGIPDAQDKCPNEPEDRDGFEDQDGCPDADNDGDGIPDVQDKCPNEPEDKDGFQDDDGCPDPDNDGDGIPDAQDRCPDEPETMNGVDDEDGCPDTAGAVSISGGRVDLPEQVQFALGRAEILPRSYSLLDRVAKKLVENPNVHKVRVEGHTDDQGSAKLNHEVSQARAQAVRDYLIGKGVEASRLEAEGLGATRPIASNRTRYGQARNRRVEFIIVEQ